MFFCILMVPVVCRMDASASETLKDISFTTPTQNVEDTASISVGPEKFGLSDDWVGDTNEYNITVNITPIYDSIWVRYGSKKINLAKEPEILNQIKDRVEISSFTSFVNPVYDNNGNVSSYSQSYSISLFDLETGDLNFYIRFPADLTIESILSECGYDEVDEVYSVQYSVRFKVKASLSLTNGASPAVKLSQKSISGYVNNIFYISGIVANQRGNYKIVKAKSSNSAVAAVSSSSGKITLKKPGTCNITVTNFYGKSASFKVTVKKSVISREKSSITGSLGTSSDLQTDKGAVSILGNPKYTLKSSNSSIVSVKKSGNQPIITCKKTGSAVITFTSGSKKFNVRVKVTKPRIVLASSITLKKGNNRTISANECSDDIYIKKVTSVNGLLSVKISSNARAVTLTANKSFSGTSTSEKVIVTFNNGTRKNINVKITQPKPTKKFTIKDVKIKLKSSYWDWDNSKACLEYTITNNSSKDLKKFKVYYSGIVDDDVSGYININSSISRGKSKTFTTKFGFFDYIEGATLKVVSAS